MGIAARYDSRMIRRVINRTRVPFHRTIIAALSVTTLWITEALVAQTTRPETSQNSPTRPERTLVIVHSPALIESARDWAAYRTQRGWRVVLLESSPAIDLNPGTQRKTIQAAIRAAHANASAKDAAQFAVMLLGDDDVLPAWRYAQTDPLVMDDDRQYISDQPYQFADDRNQTPDFPLGRVPARSNDDARSLLKKIRTNESNAHLAGLNGGSDDDAVWGGDRVTYIAGEGHFGPMDPLLEALFIMMVDRFVPDAFDLSMTYAKATSPYCPPPGRLTATVLDHLGAGGVLFNYVGHGWERGLDSLRWNNQRIPILRTSDLDGLVIAANKRMPQRPVAFMSCCSVGHFDMADGEMSFSEAMLFHPAGPIAVISGSRITHPYANTVLQKDITHALLIDRAATAGMLDYLADRALLRQDADDAEVDMLASVIARSMKWATSLKDLRIMHARMYNLLGDPATELALTEIGVKDLQVIDGRLTGTAEGIVSGEVVARIETPRPVIAKADQLQAVADENDPDLDAKAAKNYPLANDRLLIEVRGAVKDGRFDLALPATLPPNAAVIRVRAEGVDRHGVSRGVIGSMRLPQSK